jgi:hypothetical protein
MPQPRNPPAAPPRLSVKVPAVEKSIQQAVTTRMRQRLGIAANKPLPAEVDALIAAAASTAAQTALDLSLTRDVNDASSDVARGGVLDRFDLKADLAGKALDHISTSGDVKNILKRRAEMLAAKKQALQTAGFSPQEAMDILLADIAARG